LTSLPPSTWWRIYSHFDPHRLTPSTGRSPCTVYTGPHYTTTAKDSRHATTTRSPGIATNPEAWSDTSTPTRTTYPHRVATSPCRRHSSDDPQSRCWP